MAEDVSMSNPLPWYTAKKRKVSSSVSPVKPVTPLTNRFAPLAPLISDSQPAATSNNSDCAMDDNEPEVRPPAFYISGHVDSVEAMTTAFVKIAGQSSFTYRCVGDNIKINATSVQSYKMLTKYCKDHNMHYYTHQLKTDRAFKVILKNLHHSFPVSSLTDEIQAKGHTVRRINNMWNKRTNEPFNMFCIELEPAPNNKEIYNLRAVDHCIVVVEPPLKRKEEIQCHRCQDYGHTKNYCERPPRCVKCAEDHHTSDCKRDPNAPPQCALCNEQHTANYRGCPIYKRRIALRQGPTANHTPRFHQDSSPSTREMPPRPRRPSFQMDQHQFPHLKRQVPENSHYYTQPQGAWSLDQRMTRLENLMEKQIEMTNNLLATMSNLINSLCQK